MCFKLQLSSYKLCFYHRCRKLNLENTHVIHMSEIILLKLLLFRSDKRISTCRNLGRQRNESKSLNYIYKIIYIYFIVLITFWLLLFLTILFFFTVFDLFVAFFLFLFKYLCQQTYTISADLSYINPVLYFIKKKSGYLF